MNNLELTVALATAPSSAFAELRERPKFWFPLLLVVLTTAGLVYWYYSIVDIEWFKETMYGSNPDIQQLTDEKRAQAMSILGRNSLLWGSVAATLIFVPVFFLLEGLYLLLAAKVTRLPQGFGHWFALVCWSSLPVLLGSIVSVILLILSDNSQVPPGVLQSLSLNELLFHVPVGAAGYSLVSSLSIPAFLSYALMIIGIRTWSQRSWAFSAAIVLLPVVVIYGTWAFFAFG